MERQIMFNQSTAIWDMFVFFFLAHSVYFNMEKYASMSVYVSIYK